MCLDENTLIRLAAGELTAQAREQCLAHLEQCPTCAEGYARLLRTWELLGHWQVNQPAGDLTAVVLAAARRPVPHRSWVAAAAVVLIAAGAGVVAGVMSTPRTLPPTAKNEVTEGQVVEAISMDVLYDNGAMSDAFLLDTLAPDATEDQL